MAKIYICEMGHTLTERKASSVGPERLRHNQKQWRWTKMCKDCAEMRVASHKEDYRNGGASSEQGWLTSWYQHAVLSKLMKLVKSYSGICTLTNDFRLFRHFFLGSWQSLISTCFIWSFAWMRRETIPSAMQMSLIKIGDSSTKTCGWVSGR